MTAMGVGLGEHEGKATDDFIAFYARRAQGGCGLIITEITRVTEGHGIGEYDQLSLPKMRISNHFQSWQMPFISLIPESSFSFNILVEKPTLP